MANPSKAKGDAAEREVEKLLREILGVPARRKLGAGRQDDMGDIDNVPETTIQVAAVARLSEGLGEKVRECVAQQERAQTRFGATFLRLRGGKWRVVLTPEQFSALWKAAQK